LKNVGVGKMSEIAKQNKSRTSGSAQLAKALMKCAGTGLYIIQDGKFIYVNPLFQELTGYTKQELLGVYALDLVHPDDRELVHKKAVESLKAGLSIPYEYRFQKKDGGVIWVLERLTSTTYKGKRSTIGSFMDITERKQSEEALMKSEEKYRTILEEIEEGYYETDLNGNYTFFNDVICKKLGFSREELMGMNFQVHTDPEDIKKISEAYYEIYRTGKPLKWFPPPQIRKDGVRIFAEDSVSLLKNESDEVIGFRGVSRDLTERVRMEEALRRSEERYRTIMDETHDDYFENDLAGNYTFVNEALCRSVGYTAEEMLGMNFKDTTASEDIKRIYKAFNQVYFTGIPVKALTFKFIRKDGSSGIGELSAFPMRNDKGDIVGFRGVSHDVTERVRMEEELRRSEERYRTIMNETNDDYFENDLAGNYTFVNDAFCRSLGYTLEELKGMNFKVTTAGDDIERIYKAFNQIYLTGQPVKAMIFRFIRKDYSPGVGELSAFPLRDETGKVIGFRGVSHDVTERVRMEEALKQSEERYRTILAEIEEGYYEVDLAGNIRFVNMAACRQFGYTEKELLGSNYRTYVPKEDIKSVYKAWNKVYRTGESLQSYPFTTIKKDGTQIFVESSVSPLRDKAGSIIGFRSVSRDVTLRKEFEQKLADMATHDSLTGLPNRSLLSDRLTMGLALSRRNGNRLAILMLDLDKFKVINDTMGHAVGDELLKAVAERLTNVTRRSDTVARIGGDEFVLVLPQVSSPDVAGMLAQRILDAFQDQFIFDGHDLKITTSIGIAVYPDDGKDIDVLLKNADQAMYRAKEEGRDMYKYYGDLSNISSKAQTDN
jgi:diguanylate cyclase (GGDEF)-like protein/PAS domain S-box-containing protein